MTSWCRGRVAAGLLAGLVTAGCAGSSGASAGTATLAGTPIPAAATATPSPSVAALPARASATAQPPTSEPAQPDATLQPPPAATLLAASSRHPGEPGSWAWAEGTNDAPWLPATALEPARLPPGPVRVELDGGIDVATWTARAATAEDERGENPTPLGQGTGPPSFDVAAGEWVVAVDVQFADGLGSAVYYWYVIAG